MSDDNYYSAENYPRRFEIGEILSVTWQFFSKNWLTLWAVFFVILLPLNLLQSYLIPDLESINFENLSNSAVSLTNLSIYLIISLIAAAIYNTITVLFVKKKLYDEPADFSLMFKETAVIFIPYFLITMIYMLFTFVGFFLLIIPGIFILVALYFASIAFVLKRSDFWGSFAYSYNLIKGRWFNTLLIGIVFGCLSLAVALFSSLVSFAFSSVPVLPTVINTALSAFTSIVIVGAVVTFINYDDTKEISE